MLLAANPAPRGISLRERWIEVVHELGAYPDRPPWDLFVAPMRLLEQSIVAFEAGAFVSATLSCRGAVEAASYNYLTRRQVEPGAWVTNFPLDLARRPRRVDFDELARGIRAAGILSPTEMKALRRIQSDGNDIAHTTAREDRKSVHAPEAFVPSYRLLPGVGSSIWVTRPQAELDLRDAIDLIRALVLAASNRKGA